MKVILISGKAQNGKDTVAQMMSDTIKGDGNRVLITHYADLLKYICKSYFGWDGVKDDNGRRMLQYVGTDVIRKQNPSLWVDFVAMMLKYFHENWDFVIIPDCRFPNEVTTLVDSGFSTVHVRVVRDNFKSPLTEEQQKHPSETALDDTTPDFTIHNNGTIDELAQQVADLLHNHLYKGVIRCAD